MFKWGKRNIMLLAVAMGTAVMILSIFFLYNNKFRKQIPPLPDMHDSVKPLQEQMSSAWKRANRNPSAGNLGMLGMVFHSGMNYDKAAICYRLATERSGEDWIWNYYLGCLNQEMGDSKSAARCFKEVTEKKPDVFMAWYYKGECYQKSGSEDSAAISFNYIIKTMSEDAGVKTASRYDYFPLAVYAKYDLARIYNNTGRKDLAENALNEIIESHKAFGPAYRLLGNILNQSGDEVHGRNFLVRANDLIENPSPVDTLLDKLSLLSRSDTYLLKLIDEAEKSVFPEYAQELVEHSLKYYPDNKYLISKAIHLYLMRGMGKKAIPYISEHIKYFRDDFLELKSVGDMLYDKRFISEALDYYNAAARIKPDDHQVWSCIVICLSDEGKKTQSLVTLDKMVETNKTNPVFLADGITLYLNMDEKGKASEWLNALNRLTPASAKEQQLAGILAEKSGKQDEAMKNYEAAFNTDPSDLTTARLLGNLLLVKNQWQKAISHFNKALVAHPNEPYLLERLGTLLVSCPDQRYRDLPAGRDLCERAFIHKSSHSVTLISAGRSLAIAHSVLGNRSEALTVIKKTIKLAEDDHAPARYLDDLKNLLRSIGH